MGSDCEFPSRATNCRPKGVVAPVLRSLYLVAPEIDRTAAVTTGAPPLAEIGLTVGGANVGNTTEATGKSSAGLMERDWIGAAVVSNVVGMASPRRTFFLAAMAGAAFVTGRA